MAKYFFMKGCNMSENKEKEYSVKEIFEMPKNQIKEIISEMSEKNLAIIEQAYKDMEIDDIGYERLKSFYKNPSKVYNRTYRAIFDLFRQPEATCAIDLNTGKVETDANGAPINYSLKVVTPFTNTELIYIDKFKNPIKIIFPKMKDARRALDKTIYEYGKEYNQELNKISDIIFIDEDREEYVAALQNIPSPSSKLHDPLRLTVTCKYKTDVERVCNLFQRDRTIHTKNSNEYKKTNASEEKRIREEEPYYTIFEETRNRFTDKLENNPKMYFDIKLVLHIPDENGEIIDIEIQFKIDCLYYADIRTHKIYEEIREIEKQINKDYSNLENMKKKLNKDNKNPEEIRKAQEISQKEMDKTQLLARKKILINRIAQINKNAIHQYNMMVVDKVRRLEDDGYLQIEAEPDFADGTYKECRDFLFNEYMPESLKDFDAKEAFSPDDENNRMCFLRMIGKLEPTFDEFSPSASLDIEEAFTNLSASEIARFEGIYQVSNRYGHIIQNSINNKRIKDNGFTPDINAYIFNQYAR